MRFIDPMPVDCPRCVKSEQPVASLLGLDAACPACGCQIVAAGCRMRNVCDDASEIGHWTEISLEVEKRLGRGSFDFSEGEAAESKAPRSRTLRDMAVRLGELQPSMSPADCQEAILAAAGKWPDGLFLRV